MAANSVQKQRRRGPGRPFKPGQSGNPKGKPPGTRHGITVFAEKLMSDDIDGVIRQVLKAAKAGDMTAARLILDRIVPQRKGRPLAFIMPSVNNAHDVVTALSAINTSLASGELTPEEANAVAGLIELTRKAIETAEIEQRLQAIERKIKEDGKGT